MGARVNMKSSISSRVAYALTSEYQIHIWLKPWLVAAELEMGVMPSARKVSMSASSSGMLAGGWFAPTLANSSLL